MRIKLKNKYCKENLLLFYVKYIRMMVYGKLAIVKDSVDDDLAEFAQWFSSINLALIFHRWFDRIPPEIEQK